MLQNETHRYYKTRSCVSDVIRGVWGLRDVIEWVGICGLFTLAQQVPKRASVKLLIPF